MTGLTTINTNDYASMAKAMGIAHEATSKAKSSSLARLRINHQPVMGTAEVKGKNVNIEVLEGGMFKLEVPDGPTYYANSIKMRPFMQRFMYKRFIMGNNKTPNRFIKTIMSDNLSIDLKDNDGGFNCGKPAGYIKDFQALSKQTQELLKQIKRVRVILGTVELNNPMNEKGEETQLETIPFIWEIDNRDAFKNVGEAFTKLANSQRLPVQHTITANTEERKMPNGNSFFIPVVSLDMSKTIQLTQEDQNMFSDFMNWIDNYNNYIVNAWSEKANAKLEEGDADIVDDMVDIEIEEEVA